MESRTPNAVLRFGAFELDLKEEQLRKSGVRLKLRPQAFRVLRLLASRSGDLVSREEIHKEIWRDALVVDFDQGLNFCIRQIRAALADNADAPRFIETVPRSGYRFLVPVQPDLPGQTDGEKPSDVRRDRRLSRTAMAACLLLFFLVYLSFSDYWYTQPPETKASSNPRVRSLAVLPLDNLSSDTAEDFFADGMTEALIGQFATARDLRVVSRTSVMQFKNAHKPVPLIAKELNVDAVIEGSVQRTGSRIRTTVRLIRADTEEHLWSNTYDRELSDILAVQSELAQAIGRQIKVRIHQQEGVGRISRSVAPDVYESYLKGRFQLHKGGRAAIEESAKNFERAIAGDPKFAPAYAGLAVAYSLFGGTGVGVSSVAETRPKVVAAATRALELDPQLAEAHAILAHAQQQEWRWSEAEAGYRRALELEPNSASALSQLGGLMVWRGRAEQGIAYARRARELDPLALGRTIQLAWLLYHTRRYSEAIRELRTVLAIEADHVGALWFLGFALIETSQFDEAIQILERAASLSGRSPAILGALTKAYGRAGRRKEALRILDELLKRRRAGYVPPAPFVHAYVGLGQHDQAFAWLERAYQERSNIIASLKVHPLYDPLRNDPRFAHALRRVGLD